MTNGFEHGKVSSTMRAHLVTEIKVLLREGHSIVRRGFKHGSQFYRVQANNEKQILLWEVPLWEGKFDNGKWSSKPSM